MKTSKRKGTFHEEVAVGYAKKMKFEVLLAAFSRMKESEEVKKKATRSKGSVIYRTTMPNGDLHYLPKRRNIHPLIHWSMFDTLIKECLVELNWSSETTTVTCIQHTKLRDFTRISYGNKHGLCSGVLLAGAEVLDTRFVRLVFSILKMLLKMFAKMLILIARIGGILEISNSELNGLHLLILSFPMKIVEDHSSYLPYQVVEHMFSDDGAVKVVLIDINDFESGAFFQPIIKDGKCFYDDEGTDPLGLRNQLFYFIEPDRFRYGFCKDRVEDGEFDYARKSKQYFWTLDADKPEELVDPPDPIRSQKLFKLPTELRHLQAVMQCDEEPRGPRQRLNVDTLFKETFGGVA